MNQSSGAEANSVRITRLKEGYSWNVIVSADDNTVEALRIAKDKAIEISGELHAALIEPQSTSKEPEEVPF